jgi:hypothetical protein
VSGVSALSGLAAVIALVFSHLSVQETSAQLRLTEQAQVYGQFNTAITDLGSPSADVRLGGIYALQDIMRDSPDEQPVIINVLAAFIRDHAPARPAPPHALAATAPRPPADIQAALMVLGTRQPGHDDGTVIDLKHADLRGADLQRANLAGADLAGADLSGAYLVLANLTGINPNPWTLFAGDATDFSGANLVGATLAGADLAGADLEYASMSDADLCNADLGSADLTSAGLDSANLEGAGLSYAGLRRATLVDTDLRGAYLRGADFGGANLSGATMQASADTTGSVNCPYQVPANPYG